jgi:hypothetical protein
VTISFRTLRVIGTGRHPLLGWLFPIVDAQLMFPYRSRTQRLVRRFMKIFY